MNNYAGVQGCDDDIKKELTDAGIEALSYDFLKDRGEVPTTIIGQLGPWSFERAWYYWVAKGPGIPIEKAEKLHEEHGEEVRVDGYCGCPSPKECFKGFAVGHYHVDSQEGLNALSATIKAVMEESR